MKKTMSHKENDIINETVFSIKIEGTAPEEKTINISRKFLNGKISSDQAITKIQKLHNIR